VNDLVYYGVHRLLGQTPTADPVTTIAYSVIGTTIAGTFVYLAMQSFSADRARMRKRKEVFAPRRQTRRRNPIRLGK